MEIFQTIQQVLSVILFILSVFIIIVCITDRHSSLVWGVLKRYLTKSFVRSNIKNMTETFSDLHVEGDNKPTYRWGFYESGYDIKPAKFRYYHLNGDGVFIDSVFEHEIKYTHGMNFMFKARNKGFSLIEKLYVGACISIENHLRINHEIKQLNNKNDVEHTESMLDDYS